MSQENVEWVRRVGEAWARSDLEGVDALVQGRLTEDVEFDPLYLDRVYRGGDGARQLFADLNETWEEYRSEPQEIVDMGEHVLLVTRITARGRGGGVPVDKRIAILGRFQGEKLVWAKSFASKQQALEAAGLRE